MTTCYCGSTKSYNECCEPFHQANKHPPTAEALMRSRYSAFVLKLESYVLNTWDKANRPKQANLVNDLIEWQKLEIIDCKKGGASDNKGIVEFKAYYRFEDKDLIVHEVSRFSKQLGQWYYLDGVFKPTTKTQQPSNLGLNAPCPCGSGKKFKRCCAAKKFE